VQRVPKDAQALAEFFRRGQNQAWVAAHPAEGQALVRRQRPDLVLVDLHLPEADWLSLLQTVRAEAPAAGIIITNQHPDLRREMLAREQGARVFLRQPFTRQWVERAVQAALSPRPDRPAEAVAASPGRGPAQLPAVRVPVGLKITLPFLLLGLAFVLASAYLIGRYVLDSAEQRFTNQLVDVGRLSADWMVQEENRRLATLRLVSRTEGVAAALANRDAEALRRLVLPIAINSGEAIVTLLDADGESLLALRHAPGAPVEEYQATRGDAAYADWPFVQASLAGKADPQGDKYAGIARTPSGDTFYVSGPVFDDAGRVAGAALIGTPLSDITRQIREATLAQVTLYSGEGLPLASSLPAGALPPALPLADAALVFAQQDTTSLTRDVAAGSARYAEIIGPWEARNGADLGLLGAALARSSLVLPAGTTQLQALASAALAFGVILATGIALARRITRPLSQMVLASTEVALGNLQVKVNTQGDDEVAVLAHAFNYMIAGLQEGFIYRDLLGRSVSPEVREQLRQAFASGNLRLEGQTVTATVLMSDIRNFTGLAEHEAPTTVLAWLNEYFGELVPVITARGGVVDKFEGDALLAFFGILPQPLSPQQSAHQACQAGVALLRCVDEINQRRAARGQAPLVTGIGINTGLVTAGGLGAADRMNYTIIGDAVNTAQRLEGYTHELGANAVVVSQATVEALGPCAAEFHLELLGTQRLRGKSDDLAIYRLLGEATPAGAPEAMAAA
jgi:adenylate cyclase